MLDESEHCHQPEVLSVILSMLDYLRRNRRASGCFDLITCNFDTAPDTAFTLNQLMDDGFVFPITEVSAKYVNSAKFDDELIIETTPEALTKAKMAFTYRILRASDDTLLVTGRTQNVFTSMETGKITRLPETYYNKLKAMLD